MTERAQGVMLSDEKADYSLAPTRAKEPGRICPASNRSARTSNSRNALRRRPGEPSDQVLPSIGLIKSELELQELLEIGLFVPSIPFQNFANFSSQRGRRVGFLQKGDFEIENSMANNSILGVSARIKNFQFRRFLS